MRTYTHILRGFGLFLGIACFAISGYGQQALPFNQYYVVPQWYNPATIGNGEATNIFLTSRFAMMDIPGRPITNGIYADGPLSNDRIGLGAYGSYHTSGVMQRVQLGGAFRYKVPFNKSNNHNLSFGVSGGFHQVSINKDEVVVRDVFDPFLIGSNIQTFTGDVNAGLMYTIKDFSIGGGGNNLIESRVKYQGEGGTNVSYLLKRHYFAQMAYSIPLADRTWFIVPQVFARIVPDAPTPYEMSLFVNWQDKLWFGAAYKGNLGPLNAFGPDNTAPVSVAPSIGGRLGNQFVVGYTNEIYLSDIGSYTGLTHEIMVGYSFGKRQSKVNENLMEELEEMVKQLEQQQALRDSLQNELMEQNTARLDSLESNSTGELTAEDRQALNDLQNRMDSVESQVSEVSTAVDSVREDLDGLVDQLIEAGVITESRVVDNVDLATGNQALKGCYVVIASVIDTRYNDEAMHREYLDFGYNVIHETIRGWYHVYTVRVDTLEEALELLPKTRAEGHPDAWIRVLK
ncbi:MAG: PorP/SprF family type IX secretion system membrane protein [Bacteroidota bacterium]|nr:PorP/SprF family type IX secretion system membrane protein [Bacteroidota bacterium]